MDKNGNVFFLVGAVAWPAVAWLFRYMLGIGLWLWVGCRWIDRGVRQGVCVGKRTDRQTSGGCRSTRGHLVLTSTVDWTRTKLTAHSCFASLDSIHNSCTRSKNKMPSHPKARSSSKKKDKTKKKKETNNGSPRSKTNGTTATTTTNSTHNHTTAADLIHAAGVQDDPVQALHWYTAALVRTTCTDELRVDVLEQRAAVYVSLGDADAARDDYQQCADILLGHDETNKNNRNKNSDDEDENDEDAQQTERTAGIFLSIGQLGEGKEALSAYQQGIVLLEQRLLEQRLSNEEQLDTNHPPARNDVSSCRSTLVSAYCAVAELYLTDLCWADDAESTCESYLMLALTTAAAHEPNHPNESSAVAISIPPPPLDALQTLASLRLSQHRQHQAVDAMWTVYETMREACQAMSALVGMRGAEDDTSGDTTMGDNDKTDDGHATEFMATEAAQNLPGFEFRVQTAKLLLECAAFLNEQDDTADTSKQEDNKGDRRTRFLQASVDVLGSLMAENDEVVEIWILAGDAFAALHPTSPELALHYWKKAVEMLDSVKISLEQQLDDAADEQDEEQFSLELEEVVGQLDDTKCKLEKTNAVK
jgi:hypothetical protein